MTVYIYVCVCVCVCVCVYLCSCKLCLARGISTEICCCRVFIHVAALSSKLFHLKNKVVIYFKILS